MEIKPRKHFLLVEDDANDARLVQIEFEKGSGSQLQLNWVKDGEQAVHYLEGNPPYTDRRKFPLPDVILLDLKMPRLNGFEFLEWLHKESPDHLRLIPVVVMSGSDLQEDIRRAYELGANCYLTKPPDWKQFREYLVRIGVFWGETAKTPALPGH
jgi:CheY-like chemotaxis protein